MIFNILTNTARTKRKYVTNIFALICLFPLLNLTAQDCEILIDFEYEEIEFEDLSKSIYLFNPKNKNPDSISIRVSVDSFINKEIPRIKIRDEEFSIIIDDIEKYADKFNDSLYILRKAYYRYGLSDWYSDIDSSYLNSLYFPDSTGSILFGKSLLYDSVGNLILGSYFNQLYVVGNNIIGANGRNIFQINQKDWKSHKFINQNSVVFVTHNHKYTPESYTTIPILKNDSLLLYDSTLNLIFKDAIKNKKRYLEFACSNIIKSSYDRKSSKFSLLNTLGELLLDSLESIGYNINDKLIVSRVINGEKKYALISSNGELLTSFKYDVLKNVQGYNYCFQYKEESGRYRRGMLSKDLEITPLKRLKTYYELDKFVDFGIAYSLPDLKIIKFPKNMQPVQYIGDDSFIVKTKDTEKHGIVKLSSK